MKAYRDSVEYEVNREALYEMECLVPMTLRERKCIHRWVDKGNNPDSNPWGYYDADGEQLNYLQAFRLHFGYSEGPWDYWKGACSADYGICKLIESKLIPIDDL